ncbi:hypothetical protein F751_4762 [Auxenochlorella protothecoides]|uniref:Uncharacterized protein n=1 Tax=Auxenochlorella protothecoides TaxID=3075 RepID=A0A087SKL5_AUXPR|nr:hypothetical protein F751_4762 [Auxenochlorella protothecoides]KFM26269.1 hypothetical protein F751_4762 [Auxenochlorella protothecoides]
MCGSQMKKQCRTGHPGCKQDRNRRGKGNPGRPGWGQEVGTWGTCQPSTTASSRWCLRSWSESSFLHADRQPVAPRGAHGGLHRGPTGSMWLGIALSHPAQPSQLAGVAALATHHPLHHGRQARAEQRVAGDHGLQLPSPACRRGHRGRQLLHLPVQGGPLCDDAPRALQLGLLGQRIVAQVDGARRGAAGRAAPGLAPQPLLVQAVDGHDALGIVGQVLWCFVWVCVNRGGLVMEGKGEGWQGLRDVGWREESGVLPAKGP